MNQEQFAQVHGFESYNRMLSESKVVIYDHGITYYATPTSKGWITWIDKYSENILGQFETFEQAQNFIVNIFEEVTKQERRD